MCMMMMMMMRNMDNCDHYLTWASPQVKRKKTLIDSMIGLKIKLVTYSRILHDTVLASPLTQKAKPKTIPRRQSPFRSKRPYIFISLLLYPVRKCVYIA